MIEPTVGRIVWYWPAMEGGFNRPDMVKGYMERVQPHAAIVTFVHPLVEGAPQTINIARFSPDAVAIPHIGVPLVQDDEPKPTHGGWAEWMPYQKGQAKMVEKQPVQEQPINDNGRRVDPIT